MPQGAGGFTSALLLHDDKTGSLRFPVATGVWEVPLSSAHGRRNKSLRIYPLPANPSEALQPRPSPSCGLACFALAWEEDSDNKYASESSRREASVH